MQKAKCLRCGDSFTPRKSGKAQVYCSSRCRQAHKAATWRASHPGYEKQFRKPPKDFKPKPCKHCGATFKPIRSNHVYCSKACDIAAAKLRNAYQATCRECGARFDQQVKNQRYCQRCVERARAKRDQQNQVKARLHKDVRPCAVCGEPFTVYRSTSLYCTNVCAGKARRERAKANATRSKSKIKCEYCGKDFMQRHPHQRFCSRSCNQMNWHYTERGQDKKYWTSYRLRFETVQEILAKQGNACAICGREFGEARKESPHVDHDHNCCPKVPTCGKCNRGIICGNCNTMLGMAQDDPAILTKAAKYLKGKPLPGPNKD